MSTAFLPYLNFTKGIRLKYPADWVKEERMPDPVIVIFLSQAEGPTDRFRENVNIMMETLPPGVTLQNYVDYSLNTLKNTPGSSLIESGPTTMANLPAYKTIFSVNNGQMILQYQQISTCKGNKVFTVTYTAEKANYDKFLSTIETLIGSIEIV